MHDALVNHNVGVSLDYTEVIKESWLCKNHSKVLYFITCHNTYYDITLQHLYTCHLASTQFWFITCVTVHLCWYFLVCWTVSCRWMDTATYQHQLRKKMLLEAEARKAKNKKKKKTPDTIARSGIDWNNHPLVQDIDHEDPHVNEGTSTRQLKRTRMIIHRPSTNSDLVILTIGLSVINLCQKTLCTLDIPFTDRKSMMMNNFLLCGKQVVACSPMFFIMLCIIVFITYHI